MKKYKGKSDKLAHAPVKSLITGLSVPTIITMLVSAVYNMADSYYVGKIDTTSVASIGIVFSVMTLLQAIGFFLGNGSGILISTLLGEGKRKTARLYANAAFFAAFFAGIAVAVLGFFFSKQLAYLLGATHTTVEAAAGYLKYIMIGAPFMLCSFVLNNQLRYQGSALYSMIGISIGSVLNIIIDPIFIYNLDMGVEGAAIATVISQAVGFLILLAGTYRAENIRITIKDFKPSIKIYASIAKNGVPSLARQGIQTVATICLNHACADYGDAAIAAMSVFNRVMFLGMAVVIGFGQGFQPVCSFNNGAKKYRRVYDGYKFTIIISTIAITLLSAAAYIFANQIIALFRDDPKVIEIGARALKTQAFVMPLLGYCTASNMLMQSLKISGKATVLAIARQGLFYVPLIFALPALFGLNGIIFAQPAADLLSFVITLFLVPPKVKELKKSSNTN